MRTRPQSTCTRTRGFSLLEIIVVVAILSILSGVAVPVVQKAIATAARKATREELNVLAGAALEYCRDTNNVPRTISDLERDPRRADSAGWAGPYVAGAIAASATKTGYVVDGWSRDYRVTRGTTLTLTSAGDDGAFGDANDIAIVVNFTGVRREKTLEKLKIVNQAIVAYNAAYQTSSPLPANYSTALNRLVATGFLPDRATYLKDAWNANFTGAPSGVAPMVKARSSSIPSTP
ncbi:MAG: prepilin-type N-terminal cleavage/methylation domain-containing protein [Planctomycetota bacterium]|nr:prepilin-type N-terminal cleavage/methylation domain-containing protein [Planctomycetota bacterium]